MIPKNTIIHHHGLFMMNVVYEIFKSITTNWMMVGYGKLITQSYDLMTDIIVLSDCGILVELVSVINESIGKTMMRGFIQEIRH